jgi:endonuclease/exonuclease/phosphatase family metal-dependent hydrolase
MRRFVPTIFLLTVPTQILLWTLGSFANPHPYWFAVLLACGLSGAILGIVIASFGGTDVAQWLRILSGAVGVCVIALIAAFVWLVLTNDDAELPVVNRTAKAAGARLRILDLNVLHGFPEFDDQEKRFQLTIHEFRRIDADVIVLQEAWSTTQHGFMAERLARKLGMNFTYARANGSRSLLGFEEGSAILSRFPISNARRVLLSPHQPSWENRIAVLADIDLDGEVVTIAGVHLSTSVPDAQAEHLLTILPMSKLLFVAGDFNATAASAGGLAMQNAGFQRLASTETHLFFLTRAESRQLDEPIDHIFLAPKGQHNWRVERAVRVLTSAEIGPCEIHQPISDHDAIVVELSRR